ncbi:MAG: isoprenylcysteine carboxylmethyltransferase family protein [Pseudomonadota bacterium]
MSDEPHATPAGPAPETDHPNVPVHPPVVFVGAFVAAVVLELAFPSKAVLTLGRFGDAAGMLIAAAGFLFGAWALLAFRKGGENPLPNTRTETVLDTGPYRYSRNPMYVAMALVSVGMAFAFSNAWLFATTIAAMIVIRVVVISREEAYLQKKFGGAYTAYKKKVRRWL